MNNNEALERFDQANSVEIDKLFWIAASFESLELVSFLEDLDDNNWKECLPELFENEYFEDYKSDKELNRLLLDHDKLGFIAEVTFPRNYNFRYNKKGESIGWSSNGGIRTIKYIYAETTEELLAGIEKLSEKVLEEDKITDKRMKLKSIENAKA